MSIIFKTWKDFVPSENESKKFTGGCYEFYTRLLIMRCENRIAVIEIKDSSCDESICNVCGRIGQTTEHELYGLYVDVCNSCSPTEVIKFESEIENTIGD